MRVSPPELQLDETNNVRKSAPDARIAIAQRTFT